MNKSLATGIGRIRKDTAMAKDKDKGNGSNGAKKVTPPAGFRRLTADKSAPWAIKKAGAIWSGHLMGRFTMKDKDGEVRAYYQIKNTGEAVECVGKEGDAKIELFVEKGNLFNIDENKAVEILRPLAESDGKYDIWIQVGDKTKVPGSKRTFWNMEVFTNVIKAPTSRVALPTENSTKSEADTEPKGGDDQDIPF